MNKEKIFGVKTSFPTPRKSTHPYGGDSSRPESLTPHGHYGKRMTNALLPALQDPSRTCPGPPLGLDLGQGGAGRPVRCLAAGPKIQSGQEVPR